MNVFHRNLEAITAGMLLLLGLAIVFICIPGQVLDPNPMIPNAKTFPYVITWIFNVLCLLWMIGAIGSRRKPEQTEPSKPAPLFIGLGVGLSLIAMFIFINEIGYFIGSTIAVATVIMVIDGMRRWRMAFAVGIVVTVVYALFFGKLLHIEIPVGLLSLI